MSVVCTLYEGNYHCGVAALINSLCYHGFRGLVFAGYRGDTLPPWASAARRNGSASQVSIGGSEIHFVPLATTMHLNNYKTQFLLELVEKWCPKEESFYYFDPDIVVKMRWSFFEEWVTYGTAVCEDVNHYQPRNHPIRQAWKKYAGDHGLTIRQESDNYYNAGFVGFQRQRMEFLKVWRKLIDDAIARGADLSQMKLFKFEYPYLETDQELLNLALMISPEPLSIVGPEGMDFAPGGYLLSHSAGSTKSWSKHFIREALTGYSPTITDKEFLFHSRNPIPIYTPRQLAMRQFSLRIGSAIGRFYRRA